MARVYTTGFDTDTAGALPSGWVNRVGTSWLVSTSNPITSPNTFFSASNGNFVDYPQAPALLTDGEVGYSFIRTLAPYKPQGIAIRMNGSAFSSGYLVIFTGAFDGTTNTGTAYLFRRDGGGWTDISSQQITVAGSPVNGGTIHVALSAVGTTLTLCMWAEGTTRPTSGTGFVTWNDSNVSGAGYPGLYALSDAEYVDDFYVDNLVAGTTYSVEGPLGGAVGVASSTFSVAVSGTISSTVFTPSDSGAGGSFSPTTLTLSGTNPSGTFTYTPASTGTKSITVTNNGGFTIPSAHSYAVAADMIPYAVNNAGLLWSCGSWDDVAVGTYGVSVRSMQSATSGAYLKFSVEGSTDVSILIDSSISADLPAEYKPTLHYTIDGGTEYSVTIDAQSEVSILSGGTSSLRAFRVWLVSTQYSEAVRFSNTAGVSFTNGVRIQGVSLNTSATFSQTQVEPNKLIFYGDSIVEGQRTGVGNVNNPMLTALPAIAAHLSAEYGEIGYGSQGWMQNGSASATFPNTWDRTSIDRPRNLDDYQYVFCMHGTNDGYNGRTDAQIRSVVAQWLPSTRTAFGDDAFIFMVIPPGGFVAQGIIDGVNDYKNTHTADTLVFVIDMRSNVNPAYFNESEVSIYSYDGIHPNEAGNALISNEINTQVDAILEEYQAVHVTYASNRETSGDAPTDTTIYHIGDTVVALGGGTLSRDGHSFGGWSIGQGSNILPVGATFTIEADTTLYPYWERIEDYVFSEGDTVDFKEPIIVTAQWEILPPVETYSVTYNGNNNNAGSSPVDSTEYNSGDSATIMGNTGNLVRNGYTFGGWRTSPSTGTVYSAGGTISINADVTLYAYWIAALYSVTYNGNGADSGAAPTDVSSYTYNGPVMLMANSGNLVKAGATFAGWRTAPNGGTLRQAGSVFNITENTILYANWSTGGGASPHAVITPPAKSIWVSVFR